MSNQVTPSGVVAILTRPNGVVVASVVDCDDQKSGHSSVTEAQDYRARHALANATLRALCTEDIADVIPGYMASEIMRALVQARGYRVTTIPFDAE